MMTIKLSAIRHLETAHSHHVHIPRYLQLLIIGCIIHNILYIRYVKSTRERLLRRIRHQGATWRSADNVHIYLYMTHPGEKRVEIYEDPYILARLSSPYVVYIYGCGTYKKRGLRMSNPNWKMHLHNNIWLERTRYSFISRILFSCYRDCVTRIALWLSPSLLL